MEDSGQGADWILKQFVLNRARGNGCDSRVLPAGFVSPWFSHVPSSNGGGQGP